MIAACLGGLVLVALVLGASLLRGDSSPGTAVGDCVKLTSTETATRYEKVSCDGRLHNYTVSRVLGSRGGDCGEAPHSYTTYDSRKDLSEHLCLIPVFFDGECYDFTSHLAENKRMACGTTGATKVRVLTNVADEAACGPESSKAMAFKETTTTYCFTPGS
ncbi:hypothetical protein OG205_46080 [Lentzea sp. NBC_00516]|uniref:LppU/SCO3897 family protein n=1 Tax=Lentzea sp. NBC_00516 TaxID=2903582 RepID=UPI002E817FF4|nr:hypothetical protein [Lentzea sp. NBC_00516]WUD25299.1 hypothetical protein OG205_46080 [Lentzea sp. NBC_00516]